MDFWDVFLLLVIFIPLVMMWGFGVLDIFRRDDLSGGWKAVWLVVVLWLPLIGSIVYLACRPSAATPEERAVRAVMADSIVTSTPPVHDATTSHLQVLADLHDRAKLTDDEFAEQKARILRADPTPFGV